MIYMHLAIGLLLAMFLLVPLVIKWELDKAITFPAILIIGILAGLAIPPLAASWDLPSWGALFLEGSFIVVMAGTLLLWRFFRDPERDCIPAEKSILSAADGRVIYVKKFESGMIPVSEKQGLFFTLDELTNTKILHTSGYLIGAAMTYLDVHVNRAPIAGKISLLEHIGGAFHSLKHPDAVFQNERATTVIEAPDIAIGVVQIASRMVRNIIPFVNKGAFVQQGQRIGKIRFGSQVDLILPDRPTLEILVAPGDKLKAGLSVIARY